MEVLETIWKGLWIPLWCLVCIAGGLALYAGLWWLAIHVSFYLVFVLCIVALILIYAYLMGSLEG